MHTTVWPLEVTVYLTVDRGVSVAVKGLYDEGGREEKERQYQYLKKKKRKDNVKLNKTMASPLAKQI